ncbi:hypothetical protein MNBD_ALPHA02-92 [hydrothermal vent metagenome]|uniref:Uncharacterized protein n=1 Tax=hydrothermal vent metagenome TaxID=652676 RepID=A0A3B0SAU1_9ZZZZ
MQITKPLSHYTPYIKVFSIVMAFMVIGSTAERRVPARRGKRRFRRS